MLADRGSISGLRLDNDHRESGSTGPGRLLIGDTIMRYQRRLHATIGLVSALLMTAGLVGRSAAASASAGAPQPAPNQTAALEGTWVLLSTEDPSANPAVVVGSRVKTITNTGFVVTAVHPQTGDVLTHHGGAYTFRRNLDAETIEYANAVNRTLVGRTFRFKIEVDGDTWRQVGVGNRWTEVWKRLMATERTSHDTHRCPGLRVHA